MTESVGFLMLFVAVWILWAEGCALTLSADILWLPMFMSLIWCWLSHAPISPHHRGSPVLSSGRTLLLQAAGHPAISGCCKRAEPGWCTPTEPFCGLNPLLFSSCQLPGSQVGSSYGKVPDSGPLLGWHSLQCQPLPLCLRTVTLLILLPFPTPGTYISWAQALGLPCYIYRI